MDKVKEKAPASDGAEVSASEIIFNESITPIHENVKRGKKEILLIVRGRKFESMKELREVI